MELMIKFPGDEAGGAMVEYGLLMAAILVAIAASINFFGLFLLSFVKKFE